MTLYRRLLGDRFDRLHPVLQRFHDSSSGGRGGGRLRVTHPGGRAARTLARCLRLPPAADSVPVRIEVAVEGQRERWIRSFAGRLYVTVQSRRGEWLVESAGPLSLGFDVAVDEGNMLFTTRRAWVFGLPIPLGLAPNVRAAVKADELGWWLSVDVAVRGIGSLLGYEGHVTPE